VAVPRVLGLIMFALATTAAHDVIAGGAADGASTSDTSYALVAYWAVLIGGVVFQSVAARASLHRPYRDRLSSCFAVRRQDGSAVAVSPTAISLSELAPPPKGSACSFPRLLIFATANVKWKSPDGRSRPFAPFVFSHDRCGVPAVDDASFTTARLETRRAPATLLGPRKEPLVSLMTGVATTGAAVSPSMGKETRPPLRPWIALFNVRLGRWLPNPLSARLRNDVDGPPPPFWLRWTQKRVAFGSGYDEFLPELLGLHRSDGPRVYLSDGGHYDNLGLLPLLWARCSEIWAIDSEADEHGHANQLRSAIRAAETVLGIVIDELDIDRFEAADGLLGAAHDVGVIRYPGGHIGHLVVIKLGLTAQSPQHLVEYRTRDRKFPHHGTFRYQLYSAERMNTYRQLGASNAATASNDPRAPARPRSHDGTS